MTKPRRHIAGQVSMLTRRCAERRYFLRPDFFIKQVTTFEIGKAATRHGQKIYGAVVMSNHIHVITGDATGHRSRFMQDSMSGIARARNCDLDRGDHFWESGSYGDTVLLDRDAIERKLLYVWLNPVRAGLVKRAKDWPGLMILPEHWGETIRIERPNKFYGRRNPEVVEFKPQPPPGYEDMGLKEIQQHFENLLDEAEKELAAHRKKNSQRCKGVDKVKKIDPLSKPETRDLNRGINPRFATTDAKLLASAVASYRAFCDRYESRRERWVAGKKKVIFPCGTVWLKRCAPIRCKEPPEDEPGLLACG